MLGNLLGGFITILIGVNLIGPMADDVYKARYSSNSTGDFNPTNVTGASATLIVLTPLFFSLGILAGGVALTVSGLRNAGVM